MVVFLIVGNVSNLFSDNELTDLFEAWVRGGLGFKWKPGDLFVELLRLVSPLQQTTTKSQKLLLFLHFKRPVRLCSRSLGKVAPAGHLPENQAAGVHVDPGHSLLDMSVLVDLGDQGVKMLVLDFLILKDKVKDLRKASLEKLIAPSSTSGAMYLRVPT